MFCLRFRMGYIINSLIHFDTEEILYDFTEFHMNLHMDAYMLQEPKPPTRTNHSKLWTPKYQYVFQESVFVRLVFKLFFHGLVSMTELLQSKATMYG